LSAARLRSIPPVNPHDLALIKAEIDAMVALVSEVDQQVQKWPTIERQVDALNRTPHSTRVVDE
jgi:hypothetical protein